MHSGRPGLGEGSLAILERDGEPPQAWDPDDAKRARGLPPGAERLPGLYLPCFDMLLTEDAAWLMKAEPRKEPEQCPVIDSQGLGLPPGLDAQAEERSLEQVQSMVVGEVLKDIETACKLLNINPGRCSRPTWGPHGGVGWGGLIDRLALWFRITA